MDRHDKSTIPPEGETIALMIVYSPVLQAAGAESKTNG